MTPGRYPHSYFPRAGCAEPADLDDIMNSYEELVGAAIAAAEQMDGWDFRWLADRTSGGELSWSYTELARAAVAEASALLDLDTGGGEQLAGLVPLPAHTVATESWGPNLPVARGRLEPLGVEVRPPHADRLPADAGEFDLVLNRHGAQNYAEIERVLRPGGIYLTQQPGSRNDLELTAALGAEPPVDPESHTLDRVVDALRGKGFEMVDAREEMVEYAWHDIGAIVYQLLVVSWHLPGFDVESYDVPLRALDARIRSEGPFISRNHRFLIRAQKLSALRG